LNYQYLILSIDSSFSWRGEKEFIIVLALAELYTHVELKFNSDIQWILPVMRTVIPATSISIFHLMNDTSGRMDNTANGIDI